MLCYQYIVNVAIAQKKRSSRGESFGMSSPQRLLYDQSLTNNRYHDWAMPMPVQTGRGIWRRSAEKIR
jgi:hypothetical protein